MSITISHAWHLNLLRARFPSLPFFI
uniref:Uncharacterized protein n=1 Tax=Anguilla anguilla TaxID=7936 RepID=A0A0E9SBB9_ANGAN